MSFASFFGCRFQGSFVKALDSYPLLDCVVASTLCKGVDCIRNDMDDMLCVSYLVVAIFESTISLKGGPT